MGSIFLDVAWLLHVSSELHQTGTEEGGIHEAPSLPETADTVYACLKRERCFPQWYNHWCGAHASIKQPLTQASLSNTQWMAKRGWGGQGGEWGEPLKGGDCLGREGISRSEKTNKGYERVIHYQMCECVLMKPVLYIIHMC